MDVDETNTPRPPVTRMLPTLDDATRPYWTGGAQGQLLIMRGRDSGRFVHPPSDATADDGPLEPVAVSGRGVVFTFTVNEQQFHPDIPPPTVIALVELVEQPGLRLPTNIVGCAASDVRVGMPVHVVFEQHGEIFVPVFEPDSEPPEG